MSRVLFVADLIDYGTSRMRMLALQDLGEHVGSLDSRRLSRWGGRWLGALFRRWWWGPPLWRLNREIAEQIRRHHPQILWVEKGLWVTPKTLAWAREPEHVVLVHYTPDPSLHTSVRSNRSPHFVRAIPVYDLIVTTKSYEVEAHRQLGARHVLFQHPAFDRDVHRPLKLTPDQHQHYASDVTFVGRWEPERERLAAAIFDAGIQISIWGSPLWGKRGSHTGIARHAWRGGIVMGRKYALALCGAKIAMGFLCKLHPDQTTTRSVEIPACGTFMLAERTDEHLELFEEGKEAEFFAGEDEMLDKVHYYLKHDRERERIAAAGRERCLKSGYSNHDRMREILEEVDRLRS